MSNCMHVTFESTHEATNGLQNIRFKPQMLIRNIDMLYFPYFLPFKINPFKNY